MRGRGSSRTSTAGLDALDEWSRALAAGRAGARQRVTARRRRRQALPAIVTGSLTLAGLGASMSWVNTRIPAAKAEPSHGAAGPASDTAAISALDRQLSADDQAVAVLARRAEAAKTAATTRPPVPGASLPTARPAASSGAAPSSGSSIVVPTLAPLPPLPSQPAPTTHATTGASHAG